VSLAVVVVVAQTTTTKTHRASHNCKNYYYYLAPTDPFNNDVEINKYIYIDRLTLEKSDYYEWMGKELTKQVITRQKALLGIQD
jgi:hypothetical protein